ncbi:helix-turn-helix transcriptional regulator [Vibrio natriegens]|jgi:AraC-like DNA-binding protein|uniref:helix-turn-helix transcriptional regulator n=1 Tax=Vibrio TaxID=662 RepID=UPI002EBDC363|nr:helix-turn-helix transcriptional regulator [Vibrio sp. YYF0003]
MIRKRVINLSHKIEGSLFTRNSHIISISGEGIIFYNGGIKKVQPNVAIFIPPNALVRFSLKSISKSDLILTTYHVDGMNLSCRQEKTMNLINAYIEVNILDLKNKNTLIELINLKLDKIKNNKVLCNYEPLEKKINEIINKDLKRKWSLEDICNLTYTSKSTLTRKLKNSQTSMGQIISNARLEYATVLITNTSLSVDEISMQSGFNSTSYFCKKFKEAHGFSPRQFRKILAMNK